MSTKPSPDALKMLYSINDYFKKLFETSTYSHLFRREFFHRFKIERASAFSIFGNYAYIVGLGLIDCWDFDKNISAIEKKINETIQCNQEKISHLNNLIPVVTKEIREGRLDKEYWDLFNDTLKEVQKWEGNVDDEYIYLPHILNKLNGNVKSDYKILIDHLKQSLSWKKDDDKAIVLYQQLCTWIDDDTTKTQYGERRWKAMKEKFALMDEMWFSLKDDLDFEKSKQLISEVFYPDQEKYYKRLEEWAENGLNDKQCASWIKGFLWKGRTLPIRQVQVLRFKGNIDKGKTFLLSKYKEKLKWDEKKSRDREYAHNSVFDTFDENYNSFQEIWTDFENEYSLFPKCICSNVDSNRFPKLSMFVDWSDGIKIQHDTIHYSIFVVNMTLEATNRYFYTYRSKYKESRKKIIIYGDNAFKLIKDYLAFIMPDMEVNDNIVGCMSLIDISLKSNPKGITSLLSYTKEDYDPNPKIIAHFDITGTTLSSQQGFQNTLGLRLFTNAAIFQIAKRIGHSIDLSIERTLSDKELSSLLQSINNNIDKLTDEDRYLCHFINYSMYKFPVEMDEIFKKFRLSRRLNLFHNIQQHYSTPIFCEWLFPFAKIINEYKNTEFKENTESVGGNFYNYREDINNWLNKTNPHFLVNLRILCYLNWVYVCSETGNIKKLSTLWLYHTLYKCHLGAYKKDQAFFSALLYYTCIQNERIFIRLLEYIKSFSNSTCHNHDVSTILYNIVRVYSNDFKGWRKELSYTQREFLSGGKWKHDLLGLYHNNRKDIKIITNEETSKLASELFNQISKILESDEHPHSQVLAIFENMEPFNVPDNFKYHRKQSNSYIEYNGDYSGTYAHDVMGYSNDEIDTIFDGDPNAYWNID